MQKFFARTVASGMLLALFLLWAFPQAPAVPPAPSASGKDAPTAYYKKRELLEREKTEEAERDKARAAQKGKPYTAEDATPEKVLTLDLSTIDRPRAVEEFQRVWHNPPKRQWWTGNCWCFSATSFMESEVKRQHGLAVKLSEPFTVYWEFVEKAREFVRTKGQSTFEEGSQSRALILRWKQYGVVPETDYRGLVNGATFFDQGPLMEELKGYLQYVKEMDQWDENLTTASVRLILDKHLGPPPARVTVDGKSYTPKEYLDQVLKLDLDAYVEFMSFLYEPFWRPGEYKAPDNYWHGKEYLNIPLDLWYSGLKEAAVKGYSVCIGGDVSEPGYCADLDIAVVAPFDIPPPFINQDAREYRFDAKCSTDDHGIHLVGYVERDGHDWYLIKDSSRSAQRGLPGYYFYRDDYIKLKMLTFMVHRDAVGKLLARFEAENKALANANK